MNPLTTEQQYLAAQAVSTAETVAARYAGKFPNFRDEIEEAAILGVMRAAESYDDKRTWEFWVKQCVRWTVRKNVKRAMTSIAHRNEQLAPEGMYQDDLGLALVDNKDLVASLLGLLTGPQAELCCLIYWEHKTTAEAAEILGIQPRWGRYQHAAALDIMRKHLEKAS